MAKESWNLERDLDSIRKEFPILQRCTYLISNSLGAAPKKVQENLNRFYSLWADEGVSAWRKEWWGLSRKVGNLIASLLGAREDEVTMMANATQCHWVALSTKFLAEKERRKKIVITEHDFPSAIYAISQIAKFRDWRIDSVRSHGQPGIDVRHILDRIDENTLFVATSHVYFKSGFIQNISEIAAHARRVGALTLIDGYHAPGTIPVNLKQLDVDFYLGGCLKWLCGGPGNSFLYVRPELASALQPQLTGWLAHSSPFTFSREMRYAKGSYRFMSGTPPIPCLYTAEAGLEFIRKIGLSQIREKSISQTRLIIEKAKKRGFSLFSPEKDSLRGGAVSVVIPHAFQVKQALEEKEIKVDFRKGRDDEPDIIRVGPHFYSKDEEIEILFQAIDSIQASRDFRKYPKAIKNVT